MKTRQLAHQERDFLEHCDDECFALHWEMGLGKTKLLLDVMAHLYEIKKIDAVLVIAPNSVYANWLTQEAPKHMSAPYAPMRYRVGASDEKVLRRALYLDPTSNLCNGRLRFVVMSYDAVITDKGYDFARKLVSLYRTMVICDESSKIKNGSTERAKTAKKLGKMAHYRWNATGTPISRSPFDIHSQIEFLDEDYWARYGLKSIAAFRREFGVYAQKKIWKGGKEIMVPECVSFQKLDKLTKMIAPITSRLLKEDSGVELPPKTYKTVTFELTPAQRRAYEDLRKQFLAEIEPGATVEAPMAIVRLLRLSQIASGFVTVEKIVNGDFKLTSEAGDEIEAIMREKELIDVVPPEQNPRLQVLEELLERCYTQSIVWCAFRRSVDYVMNMLGDRAARYDGKTRESEREESLRRFRNGSAQVLVANTATVSMGLTLTEAKTLFYYENTFVLENRLQSEDRAHRIGQDTNLQIVDLCAEGTVNERLLETLRERYDVAAAVNGDRYREWLSLSPMEVE